MSFAEQDIGDHNGTVCEADNDSSHFSLFLSVSRYLSQVHLPSDLFFVVILVLFHSVALGS